MHYDAAPSLPPPHTKIGLVHVGHLRAMTSALRAVDYRYGGGACRTQVQALLSWCDKAFAHSVSAAVHRGFRNAIAELHALAGWASFDAGLGGSAHRHFLLALDFAEDEDLVANIRYRMGRVHLHHGGPAEALGMFRLAGMAATSHHTNAILAANQAWCHAEMGQRVPALASLGRAHDAFARADVDGVAPWAAFFDVNDLAAITGVVYTSSRAHRRSRVRAAGHHGVASGGDGISRRDGAQPDVRADRVVAQPPTGGRRGRGGGDGGAGRRADRRHDVRPHGQETRTVARRSGQTQRHHAAGADHAVAGGPGARRVISARTRWFPATPGSLPEIRAFVRGLAGESGMHGDDARDVLLAVSEAADNAVRRAGASVVGVTWEPRDHAVLLTIEDDGVFDLDAGTGARSLGLRLLFGIADEVQVRPGKPTWPGTVVRALVRVWSRADVPDLPAPPGRPRVLLVDGDRFSGQSLAAFLHAEGYEVTLVTTIAAAQEAVRSPPALAIVDLLTSHGEGTRFAAAARTFGVPVVAVSAIEPATHVADAYLPKPAHPLRVLAAVRDLLSPDS